VNSFILNIFLVAAFNATGYAKFSVVELDRYRKGEPIAFGKQNPKQNNFIEFYIFKLSVDI